MRFFYVFIAAFFLNDSALAGNLTKFSIQDRTVVLYTPQSAEGRASALLVALHGGFGTDEQFQKIRLNRQADRYGFRIAYLNGTRLSKFKKDRRAWNAGECCGKPAQQNSNDEGHIRRVILHLMSQGLADRKNIHLVGHSNGSMMAYRFACNNHRLISSVVGISGTLAMGQCANASGIKVLHIHGQQDKNAPFAGGHGSKGAADYNHRPVELHKSMLERAGARVTLEVLSGSEHSINSLQRGLRKKTRKFLAATIADFVTASGPRP